MQNNPYGSQPPPQPYSQIKHHFNWWILAFALTFLLLIGAGIFGYWAFKSRQDYKYNSDQKVAAAVQTAQQQTASAKDKQFLQQEKNPLKDYHGPAAFGSLDIKYPKTWSAFVTEIQNTGSSTPVDGYFYPVFVPGIQSGTNFALRVQVVTQAYDQILNGYQGLVKQGKIRVTPYTSVKVPSVSGSRLDGEIVNQKQGSMIMLPLRDKTLKIWTEASEFSGDFNNIILPNFTFIP